MRHYILQLAQYACDLVVGSLPYREGHPSSKPKLVAHRGAWSSLHIENTLAAFLKAKELGADAIELDVHFTLDDVPVAHHDGDLVRIFGHKKHIRELKFSELRELAPKVPSLAEVLEISGLHYFIEIKTELNETQLRVLESTLSPFEPLRDYHFLALDPKLVRTTDAFPARLWILVGELLLGGLVKVSIENGFGGVAGHYLGMTDRLVEKLREAKQISGVGFISSKNLFNREWSRGMDFVFTNSIYHLF